MTWGQRTLLEAERISKAAKGPKVDYEYGEIIEIITLDNDDEYPAVSLDFSDNEYQKGAKLKKEMTLENYAKKKRDET